MSTRWDLDWFGTPTSSTQPGDRELCRPQRDEQRDQAGQRGRDCDRSRGGGHLEAHGTGIGETLADSATLQASDRAQNVAARLAAPVTHTSVDAT